ncbi:hypothetical protein AB6A40_006529 [Gnathostoma spinigerum]|uniref:Granulins domain-containing protein n=1 Tax=Gnathostoma spinigerum TaxID=75299 RepID=A0ABD6EIM5_9BILA
MVSYLIFLLAAVFMLAEFDTRVIAHKTMMTVLSSEEVRDVICPDHKSKCPDGSTCCKLHTTYGCCPIPRAVCCSDHLHCCPEGTTCNVAEGTCTGEDGDVVTWKKKRPAKVITVESGSYEDVQSREIEIEIGDIVNSCQDCPQNMQCCQYAGEYRCCISDKGSCCGDKCCDRGFKCGRDYVCHRKSLVDFLFDYII